MIAAGSRGRRGLTFVLALLGPLACGPSVGPMSSTSRTTSGDSGAQGTTTGDSGPSSTAAAGSSSTTVPADGSSTGTALAEFVGFWSQGHSDSSEPHRFFVPCGLDDFWEIEGALPEVDECDTSVRRYVRVLGELVPPGPEPGNPRLIVSELVEGPCWQHTCDGGDPCDCGTFDDVCNGPTGFSCDLYQQTCPEGEKCMPWANDGGSQWNSTRCARIEGRPGQPGDPCQVEGSATSGVDDCATGSMCWGVDPMTNAGTCVALCDRNTCNPELHCDQPGTACAIAFDGFISVCLPPCDPLAPNCSPDHACQRTPNGSFCLPEP